MVFCHLFIQHCTHSQVKVSDFGQYCTVCSGGYLVSIHLGLCKNALQIKVLLLYKQHFLIKITEVLLEKCTESIKSKIMFAPCN